MIHMTHGQAVQVRHWRREEEETWRDIARLWIDTYGEEGEIALLDEFKPGPGLAGNQLVGMALCERASELLEDPVDD